MNPLDTPLPAAVVPVIAFGVFAAFWIGLTRLIGRLARMTDTVPAGAGPLLRKSRWGDAHINGSRAKGCVRVEEYASGLAVRMHPIFGGGMVWLPHDLTRQRHDDHGRMVLAHARHRVVLLGRTAQFVAEGGARHVMASATIDELPTRAPSTSGFATSPDRRAGGRNALGTIAFWVAVALLAYVALRHWAPELIAPIERMLDRR